MPTLLGTTQRLELNQSSRVPVLEQLSQEKLVLWQGVMANIECALFNDTPELASFVTDVSNIDEVNLVVRKNGPNGAIFFTKEVVAGYINTNITYDGWLAETQKHFTFEVSEVDTTQVVPSSGHLPIYFVVTVTTTDDVSYVAGFGYGEIVNVGYIDNPVPGDYVDGRTQIVGGKLLTDLDLNGHRLVDSSLSSQTESGEEALAIGQLSGDVVFEFEKVSPEDLRFARKYIKDPNAVPEDIEVVVGDITATGFHFNLSAAPDTSLSVFYWKVEPKDTAEVPVSPSPRYVAYNPNLITKLQTRIWLEDFDDTFDGVKDNAPAVAAMLTAAPRASVLVFPQNKIVYMASGVTIPTDKQGMVFEGFGIDYSGSVVRAAAGVSPFIFPDAVMNNIEFHGLRIESVGATLAAGSAGIKAIATMQGRIGLFRVENCVVTGFESGINTQVSQGYVLSDVVLGGNKYGFYQKFTRNGRFFGGDISGNTLWGIFSDGETGLVQQSCGTKVIGTEITGNGSAGDLGGGIQAGQIYILYNDNLAISNCMIDQGADNSTIGVLFKGCIGGGAFAGTYIGSSKGSGFTVEQCHATALIGCFLTGNVYGFRSISSILCKFIGNRVSDSAGYDCWINDGAGIGSNSNIVEGNSLESAVSPTDESVFEQGTNHTIYKGNVMAGKMVVSNPELVDESNYNYVTGISTGFFKSYTPTVTTQAGELTTYILTGVYRQVSKKIEFQVKLIVTTNGTAAGYFRITVPLPSVTSRNFSFSCSEDSVGVLCRAGIDSNYDPSTFTVQKYDSTYPGGDGKIISVSGWYEIP